MDDDKFFRLRYVGRRFDRTRLPLDVLADLPAFRDLLVAYAKQQWRAANSDRQRVPKGFDKSLSFDLVGIEPGSAIPALSWDEATAQEYLPGFASELNEIVTASYADVISLVDDAGHDVFPKALDPEHVRALNRLGSGLHEDERIEFVGSKGVDGNVVYLDVVRRKRLITKVRETYESRHDGIGTLIGVFAPPDAQATIKVQAFELGQIDIRIDNERVKVFDGNINGTVQFDLQIERDNNDAFRGIVQVHGVDLIDPEIGAELERCGNRVEAIAILVDGWSDGAGVAPSAEAVSAAKSFLSKRPMLCADFRIYPTLAGGVLFELVRNDWDLSVEFLATGGVELFGIEVGGRGELEPVFYGAVSQDFIDFFDAKVGR
ncbi:hypothetical protein H7F36_02870 [Variovorax sp. PAMC28562]|uniref:hypothetical protein n=1 Tax=Variovorax sp. PAMC28562 TaxID=2762323 RepID=UPI00164E6ED7|nr:hypothetical protein [Variovorax sp. PAMC28562]QNK74207.1 hypothetical protein H7F36_02870 [Variovorax sp. PAMC28562]